MRSAKARVEDHGVFKDSKGWCERSWCAVAGLACLLAGCGGVPVQVNVNREVNQTQPAKVAVVEFTHPVYQDDVADSVTFGKATSSNSGNIIADILTTELEGSGIRSYSLVSRDSELDLLRRKGTDAVSEAKRDPQGLARLLGADRVVIGNVETFESGFFMLVSWATVAYSARCIEAETGKEVWSVKGKLTRYYDYEEHVAALLAHAAAEELRAQIQPPRQPPSRPAPSPAKGGWPFWETTPAKKPQPKK